MIRMISTNQIKELRDKTGISVIECKKALEEAQGDEAKALEILSRKGQEMAAKKSEREAKQGLIEAYIHNNGKIGVLLELNCETDFVARNPQFKELAHDLAMHIAAMDPRYLSPSDIPEEVIQEEKQLLQRQFQDTDKPQSVIDQIIEGKIKKYSQEICLLEQPFVKNPDQTVQEIINDYIAKLGENIIIGKFVRLEI
jgi:elongation factor Ts